MIGRALPRREYAGGVSGQMHLLASTLARRGHQVTVYALNPPPDSPVYNFRTIPVPETVRVRPWMAHYLTPWWASRLPLDSFDVIHAHGDDHFLRASHTPVVRTFYGSALAEARYSTTLRHRLYHLTMVLPERVAEWRASALAAISKTTQAYLHRPSVVIPCGYDPAVFHPGGAKSECPSILFVGDLGTRKRGELLLDVFIGLVRATLPTAELWMVTTDRVATPGVQWFGRVATPALVDLYRRAWVFCLPSRYEGFGVPYLEAMACRTAVVATPNGGAEELLDAGHSGRIVEEAALGQELVRLLTDGNARDALAASGLARAKLHEISEIAQQYERLYEGVTTAADRYRVGDG